MADAGDGGAGDQAPAEGQVLERCRRCGDLLARWEELTGRPGEDLDPESPAGREALALQDAWEAELRWLEANPARRAEEAEAKLAIAEGLVAWAGRADPRFLAFLAQARAEDAGARRSPEGAAGWPGGLGWLGAGWRRGQGPTR